MRSQASPFPALLLSSAFHLCGAARECCDFSPTRMLGVYSRQSLRSVSHSLWLPSPICRCLSFYLSNLNFSFLYVLYFCQRFPFALTDLTRSSRGVLSFPYKYSFWKRPYNRLTSFDTSKPICLLHGNLPFCFLLVSPFVNLRCQVG